MSPQNLISILGIFFSPFLTLWRIKKGGKSPVSLLFHSVSKFSFQSASLSLFSFLKKGSVEVVFSRSNDLGKMTCHTSPKVRPTIFELFYGKDRVLAKENEPKSIVLSLNSLFFSEL
jgi:hypothetical protein